MKMVSGGKKKNKGRKRLLQEIGNHLNEHMKYCLFCPSLISNDTSGVTTAHPTECRRAAKKTGSLFTACCHSNASINHTSRQMAWPTRYFFSPVFFSSLLRRREWQRRRPSIFDTHHSSTLGGEHDTYSCDTHVHTHTREHHTLRLHLFCVSASPF